MIIITAGVNCVISWWSWKRRQTRLYKVWLCRETTRKPTCMTCGRASPIGRVFIYMYAAALLVYSVLLSCGLGCKPT